MTARRRPLPYLLLAGAWMALAAGCHLLHHGLDSPEAGVPLTRFTASDGHYFPPFVEAFFPGAREFTRQRPRLGDARADVALIELKPLNQAASHFNEANLSWSADGVYLGYEVVTGDERKIMLKDLAGNFPPRELEVIPKGTSDFLDGLVVKSAHSYNAGLRWSRDSTRFAFMSNGGVGDYGIYVGAIGAKEQRVTHGGGSKDGYATWSPKASEIAFVSARTGNGDIYVVDLKSKELARLTANSAVNIFPEWFPDGKGLVFSSGDALNHDIHVVEHEGPSGAWGKPWPLTLSHRDNLRPTVSPDGRFVAFYCDDVASTVDERRWDIAAVPFVRGKTYGEAEVRSMVVAKDVVIDLNTGPAWSPDSRKLFFVKRDLAVANPIHAVDLFTGKDYVFKTGTRMNRDILMSRLGILSFRAQVGVWDRVYVALTNQGSQLQGAAPPPPGARVHYLGM